MIYLYLLSWISLALQAFVITLSIGAGLYYLAEIVEEYATMAKKVINYTILIDTGLAIGLLLFENLPTRLVLLCIICNILYFASVQSFPVINLYSPAFIVSFALFVLHNYWGFQHFSSIYYEFSTVLCYMTLFCWLIPIGLLVSCSANDNVLPTTYQHVPDNDENMVSSYFKRKSQKLGLLSFLRYFHENYLPTVQSRKGY